MESKNCVEEGEVQNEYLDGGVDQWNGDELKEENVDAIDLDNVIQEEKQEINDVQTEVRSSNDEYDVINKNQRNDTIDHSLHKTKEKEKELMADCSRGDFREKELRTKRRNFLSAMQSYKFYETNEIQNMQDIDKNDENTIDCIESGTNQKSLNLKYLNFENLQTTVQVSTSFHLV